MIPIVFLLDRMIRTLILGKWSLKRMFPHMNDRIILSKKNIIGWLFLTKDRIPINLCSNVVYRYKCKTGGECTSFYLGSTIRSLGERICEHKGVSLLTGAKLTRPNSAVHEHCCNSGHTISEDSFDILGGCRKDGNICLLESLFI